jgi:large repetitive protein
VVGPARGPSRTIQEGPAGVIHKVWTMQAELQLVQSATPRAKWFRGKSSFMQKAIVSAGSRRRGAIRAVVFSAAFFMLSSVLYAASVFNFPGGSQTVGTAQSQMVTVTVPQAGVLSTIKVVTQGITNADFTDAGGDTCIAGTPYAAAQTCTVNVQFKPKYPGGRSGAIVMTFTSGTTQLLVTQYLYGVGKGPLPLIIPGLANTVAGNGAWLYVQDGVPATAASIFLPMGEVADAAGNVYISDSSNNRIRRVDAATSLISTVAGNGAAGFLGDGGPAINAEVSNPSSLALDGAGNLYIADSSNSAIRMINAATGIITTVAGMGGQPGYSGDGGAATSAKLGQPNGLVLDVAGNIYIADTNNNAIREVVVATGIITTIAGTSAPGYGGDNGLATAAQFNTPWGLAMGGDGSLYIADLNNNRIRKIDPSGMITTAVGNGGVAFVGDGGPPQAAGLNNPAAVAVDVSGNIYVADSGNDRIRKVTLSTNTINTIAGNGGTAFAGDGLNSDQMAMYAPYSLFIDGLGNLYVGDLFHNRIRVISSNAASLQYATIRVNRTSPPQPETLENDGNDVLNLTTLSVGSNSALDAATTTCTAGQTLAATATCTLGVEFAPTTIGTTITGAITLGSDAANSPGTITLTGTVLDVDPTTVTLASSANPSAFGTAVIFSATVSTAGTTETGTVQFLDGTSQIGTGTLSSTGIATFTTSTLALGQHSITATYTGDVNNAASTSLVLTQTVKQATQLALGSSLSPAPAASSVTFTATLSGQAGQATGTVTFTADGNFLGNGTLNGSGAATVSTALLAPGTHTISASYPGDTNNSPSQTTLQQVVTQLTTSTTVGTNNSIANAGATVMFTANISNGGGSTLTGSVTFKDGTATIGSGTVSGGVATFSTTGLAPGTHLITAVYSGDIDDSGSTSTALTQTVTQVGTTIVLGSGANPANAGGSLTLTATVTAAGGVTTGGALSGTVTFKDNGATIGTATVGAGGVASISSTTLSVGPHTITAVYGGSTNYEGSTSTALAQQVQQSTTTNAVASSADPSIAGKAVTFSSQVVSVGGIATGVVTFTSDGVTIGQGALNAQGVASLTISTLAVGTHQIVASYGGDANDVTSTSMPLGQVVNIASTALALSPSSNPAVAGVSVSFSAGLASTGGQPTGSILFKDGTTTIGTVQISGSAPVTFPTSSLSVGSHPITAFYAGDANDLPSTSAVVVEVVQQATTTTALTTNQNPAALGQSIGLTATVSSVGVVPGGNVVFQDGAVALGTVALGSNGAATLNVSTLALGTHTIMANYVGDVNHVASQSQPLSQRVLQATTITLMSSGSPSVAEANVKFSVALATVGGVVPTGTVTFMDGTSILGVVGVDGTGAAVFNTATLAVGPHPIVAVYSGDSNYQTVTSAGLTQTVQAANTTVTLISSGSPVVFGSALTFTATLTGTGGAITGTVAFEDGTTVLGTATLSGTGKAIFTTATLSPGIHTISAVYRGDANNSPNSSLGLSQQVEQTTQVALTSSGSPSLTLTSVLLTATVTNGGSVPATGIVTFTEGATVLGVGVLGTNGIATLNLSTLAAGQHTIIAAYSGDTADLASTSEQLLQTVQLRPTSDALTASAVPAGNGQQVTLISVLQWTGPVVPTGTVTFKTGSTVLGTSSVDSTGVATLVVVLSTPPETIVSSYGGDTVYSPSSSPATSISSNQGAQFTMQLSQTSATLASKQHMTVTLTVQSLGGFTDTLALGCAGLPYAATCTYLGSDHMTLAANGTQTVQIVIDTGSPLTAGPVAAVSNRSASTAVMCFLPCGALLGLLLLRARKGQMLAKLLLLLCVAGILATGLTGCGTINQTGTPAGSYTFQVTATALKAGTSEAATMALTVTQ